MKVFQISSASVNRVKVGEKLFFLNERGKRSQFLPAACPHRGGPLQFGAQSDDGHVITCPWHDIKHKACKLERNALISVRVRKNLSFIVPDSDSIEGWQQIQS